MSAFDGSQAYSTPLFFRHSFLNPQTINKPYQWVLIKTIKIVHFGEDVSNDSLLWRRVKLLTMNEAVNLIVRHIFQNSSLGSDWMSVYYKISKFWKKNKETPIYQSFFNIPNSNNIRYVAYRILPIYTIFRRLGYNPILGRLKNFHHAIHYNIFPY